MGRSRRHVVLWSCSDALAPRTRSWHLRRQNRRAAALVGQGSPRGPARCPGRSHAGSAPPIALIMTMTYSIFDSTGNLVEAFDDHDAAIAALTAIVTAEPD